MKTAGMSKSLTFFVIMAIAVNAFPQELRWDWGKNVVQNGNIFPRHVDLRNNFYSISAYTHSIQVGDTSFHVEGSWPNTNRVVARFSQNGDFNRAINLYTDPSWLVQNPMITTDRMLNIYLFVPYSGIIHFNDTTIHNPQAPASFQPSILVAKFDSDFNFLWNKFITGPSQDFLNGVVKSNDDHIYIATSHYALMDYIQVDYLGQEVTDSTNKTINSLTKMDTDGNLIWRTEIRSKKVGTDCRQLVMGGDSLIYFYGRSLYHISIGSDTLFHPNPQTPQAVIAHFLIIFDQDGNKVDWFYFDWDITIADIYVNQSGDLFVSGSVTDQAIVGNDTLNLPPGNHTIIGRFTRDQWPVWYHLSTIASGFFRNTFIHNDHFLFAASDKGNVKIADTMLVLGNQQHAIIGEFSPEGELIDLLTAKSNNIVKTLLMLDNCGNPVICGEIRGHVIFGNDTVYSSHWNQTDQYIARALRFEPEIIELGTDTTVCESYIISAPENFFNYTWNGEMTNQTFLEVTESGTYHLSAQNQEGCWYEGSIVVTVIPSFEISLGSDTTITQRDTLIISLPEGFDSYLWSDGSSADHMIIVGEDYDEGTISIWVSVSNGPCIASDTINITIKTESGIHNPATDHLTLRPNPFYDRIFFEMQPGFNAFEIINLNGVVVHREMLKSNQPGIQEIILEHLKRGFYFIRIETENKILTGKLIKM